MKCQPIQQSFMIQQSTKQQTGWGAPQSLRCLVDSMRCPKEEGRPLAPARTFTGKQARIRCRDPGVSDPQGGSRGEEREPTGGNLGTNRSPTESCNHQAELRGVGLCDPMDCSCTNPKYGIFSVKFSFCHFVIIGE